MRIHTRPRLPWVLLAACFAAAVPARAQDPDSARAVLRRDGLCPDAEVQISTTFAERFRGQCVLQDARLLVVRDGVEQPVLYTAVDSIWVRGPGTRTGAVTGAWVGAGVGGLMGAAHRTLDCDFRCPANAALFGLGGAVVGALAGWELGGAIGSGRQIWIRLYPRP